jgi:hypothetical protein
MTWKQRPIWHLAPFLLGAVFNCAVGAQSGQNSSTVPSPQPLPAAPATLTSPDTGDAAEHAARLDSLLAQVRDTSSLYRVQALAAIDASPAVDAETVRGLLHEMLEDRDPLVAQTALQALLRRGDEELAVIRETDLERFSGETKELAEVHLASSNRDVSALRALMKNGDAVVEQAAFEAFATNDARAAVDALMEDFRDTSSLSRLQTLELMIRSPYTNSAAVLMPVLEAASKDANPLVKATALRAIKERTAGAAGASNSGGK